MKILLTVLLGAVALMAYVIIEKQRSQQACAVCGLRVSADVVNQPCPRCDARINPLEGDHRRTPGRAF